MRHVVFRVGSERYALPLEAVREVVLPQPPFARVPRVSEAVPGVMNLRGRVLAVVDLAALVGLPSQTLREGSGQVLVLDQGKRAVGVLIAGVQGVEEVEPPAGEGEALVRGVVASGAGAVTVLSPEALLTSMVELFGER
ncbi:MAG TPA: chemotaxis protein CheW [Anaeromyxobacter sp.]|nr:chemotaxis protein CheW [Anaeromyxobacter sp.]